MDYKDTLNLPKTAFAMKANLAEREPKRLAQWEEQGLYQQLREHCQGRHKFILHDGPPYANGEIHLGHALNKVLKDMVVRSKTLSGFDAPYVPGWDCHGLPIELNVEKKKGKPGQKIDHAAFRQACREYAEQQVELQRQSFKRLGVLGEWENPYLTMSPSYEANIVRSLADIIENGHLSRGFKPVHWCMDCGSALAEAEVEYKDKTSASIDVRFPVVDTTTFLAQFPGTEGFDGNVSVAIWTTTPWTLPANEAVALHEKVDYALVRCAGSKADEAILVAEELVQDTMQRFSFKQYDVLGTCKGIVLQGLLLQHPFYSKQVPIVLGEHVTTESGTGAVHTAPSHGPDDYILGLKYNLPVSQPVQGNGCFAEDLPLVGGMHVKKADAQIIGVIKEQGRLLAHEKLTHSYPHCWRHKTPVIFRATPQWFVAMEQSNLRDTAMAEIQQIQWLPEWGKARIEDMIGKRPDWCVSRQRTWGVPMCLFIHKETDDLHPDTVNLLRKVADKMDTQGIEAWHELSIEEALGEDADKYMKSMDTLDVWFDSGVSHHSVLKSREALQCPADMYLEGSDQHRGWFQTSMLSAVAQHGHAPYKACLTHGYTVDEHGHKMSKSLGNVIAPDKIWKTLGADVLRMWVAATDYRGEITVSDDLFKRMSEAYRRLRNTARFLLSNINDFDPSQHLVPVHDMLALDRWALDRASQVQERVIKDYASYHFHQIFQTLYNFCAVDMGSFYLDVIKDRQYTLAQDSLGRRSAQTAMYHIAEALVRWLAPILSFTSEEIWEHLPGERGPSVLFSTWYEDLPRLSGEMDMDSAYWDEVRKVRDEVNKAIEMERKAGNIGSPLAAKVAIYCGAPWQQHLELLEDELRFVLITSEAIVLPAVDKPGDVIATDLPDVWLKVSASEEDKCERCWHRRADVGAQLEYPELCGRCVQNITGQGEHRQYA